MGPNPNEQYIRARQQEERRRRVHRWDGQQTSRTSRILAGTVLGLLFIALLTVSVLWALGFIVLPQSLPMPAT
jgi:hypothetical protein